MTRRELIADSVARLRPAAQGHIMECPLCDAEYWRPRGTHRICGRCAALPMAGAAEEVCLADPVGYARSDRRLIGD